MATLVEISDSVYVNLDQAKSVEIHPDEDGAGTHTLTVRFAGSDSVETFSTANGAQLIQDIRNFVTFSRRMLPLLEGAGAKDPEPEAAKPADTSA